MLSNQQFDRTRRLALRLAGIELSGRHRELLARRSQRIGVRDTAGWEALLGAAEAGETVARQQFVCLLTTKFTGFFRHARHFEIAAEHAVRAVSERGQARLWSAATATGEEAYSLALALMETFGREDPPVEVLATDIDPAALAAARRGEYGEASIQVIEPVRRQRFLREILPGQRWAVTPALRHLVEFQELNLACADWPVAGPFDIIFCRNVLMYLEAGYRQSALERMAALLAPEGLLMLDPTEHPGRAGHLFAPGADGVYALRCQRRPILAGT